MSRMGGGDVRTIAPTNNVYTAMAAAACVVVILGIVALVMKASNVGGLF
jgi:hypothetical protein